MADTFTPAIQAAQAATPADVFKPKKSSMASEAIVTKPKTLPTPETFTKPDTGRASGITLEDGRTFLGLSPDEVNQVAGQQAAIKARPEGTAPVGTEAETAREAARIQQLTSQIGQLTPEQRAMIESATEAPIDWGQALTAGAMNVLPSLAGGAATGALIGGATGAGVGSAVTAPVGAVIGALAGSIAGLFSGVKANIKDQQRGEIGAARDVLTNARTNMMKLSRIVSTDPSKAEEAVQLYNEQLALVYLARRKTKLEVQGNLNKFMEDGTDIMSDYDLFLMEGGQAEIYGMRLRADLGKTSPLTEAELAMWEMEE